MELLLMKKSICMATRRQTKASRFDQLADEILLQIFVSFRSGELLRSFGRLNDRLDRLIHQSFVDHLLWTDEDPPEKFNLDELRHHRIRSLTLLNICQWKPVVEKLNVPHVHLHFDEGFRSMENEERLPHRIRSFVSNRVHSSNLFHGKVLRLNVHLSNLNQLIDLVTVCPQLEDLSVRFSDRCASEDHRLSKDLLGRLKNSSRLCRLSSFSFRMSNELIVAWNSFDDLDQFIAHCCPDEKILDRITLQVFRMDFSPRLASRLIDYQSRFDQFDFYGSFLLHSNDFDVSPFNDRFAFHFEGDHRCAHLYSLPYRFTDLYGVHSISDLDDQISFSSVRSLTFTRTDLPDRPISFECVSTRFPNLRSIDCYGSHFHSVHVRPGVIIIDEGLFDRLESLRFRSFCFEKRCVCRHVLCRLLDRMPRLRLLHTNDQSFMFSTRPLTSLRHLHWSSGSFKSTDLSPRQFPNIVTLQLGSLQLYFEDRTLLIASLFRQLTHLTRLSFTFHPADPNDRRFFIESIKELIMHLQNMDISSKKLTVDFQEEHIHFYRR